MWRQFTRPGPRDCARTKTPVPRIASAPPTQQQRLQTKVAFKRQSTTKPIAQTKFFMVFPFVKNAGARIEPRPLSFQFHAAILSMAMVKARALTRADSPNQAELSR